MINDTQAAQMPDMLGGEEEYSPDLDFILKLVADAGPDVLTPEEAELYDEYVMRQNPVLDTGDHYANLAEVLSDNCLGKLAMEVINWAEWDEESRQDWSNREAKGIKALGVTDRTEGGASFDGASRVVHPLLAEAVIQFHSRAIVEMWPPEGPIKTQILGESTPEKQDQADRVKDYLNYLYTTQMPDGFEEMDNMLFRLPLSGSCFKKHYFDPIDQCICSRFIEPADFIVPYNATGLNSTPRFTHRMREMHNDLVKKMSIGYYRDVSITKPTSELNKYPAVKTEIEYADGLRANSFEENQRHTILEMYVDYAFEEIDQDETTTKSGGVAKPYIVTVDRDSQTVLRVQRNWKPDGPVKRRVFFTHFKFMPGLGFYGYGLLHLIGGLSNSATGALRAFLDAASFANLQGGFRSRDARIQGDDTVISPGEWKEVNSSADELAKAFFQLPYKEPSENLLKMIQYLDERGQRFAGTTENMIGEANNSAPVGTTLALIEQGSKSFSSIHKRLHEACTKEYRAVGELCAEYLPEEGYPYFAPGASRMIMAQDFDDRIDIIPVSDPAIISSTQRMAQSQAILDLAQKFPNQIDQGKAIERMLLAMRVPNWKELLIDKTQQQPTAEDKIADAQVKKISAETVESRIRGLYSSIQAGQIVASMPPIAQVADSIYQSAGGVDANGSPLIQPPQQPTIQEPVQPEGNTNPMTPMLPESPELGVNHGIETLRNDGMMEQ